MPEEVKNIEKRTSKLERKSFKNIIIQYMLSPLLIIIVGWMLNSKINNTKAELQKIEIAQIMLVDIFKQEDPVKAFAMQRLMAKVIDDIDLYDDLSSIIEDYFSSKLDQAIKSGDIENAVKIYTAAQTIGGEETKTFIEEVKKDTFAVEKIESYKKAERKEREGFARIIKGDYKGAIKEFETVDSIYPGFHQAATISKFLKSKENKFNDSREILEIDKQIIKEFSSKAPEDLLHRLKQKSKIEK